MSTENNSKRIAADILIAALQKADIDKIFTHGLHASDVGHIDVIKRLADAYTSLHSAIENSDGD